MENVISTLELIEKEQIPSIKFTPLDVLTDPLEKQKRLQDVSRATVLGNGYHGKVTIYFQTADDESKCVSTTIWDFDKEYIVLKSGASIPLKAVFRVEFS